MSNKTCYRVLQTCKIYENTLEIVKIYINVSYQLILSQFLAACITYHVKKILLSYSCINLILKHIFIVYLDKTVHHARHMPTTYY